MNRHIFFLLLLATAVALAEDKPKTQHSDGPAAARKKTEAAPLKTEPAQTETEGAKEPNGDGQAQTGEDTELVSVPGGKALGMSILGNQDAPKSLVIVPWKTSELGDSPGISPMLDDSRQPVDKEVFMRALRYYEIRSGTKPLDGHRVSP
jgi:hypothetical protein